MGPEATNVEQVRAELGVGRKFVIESEDGPYDAVVLVGDPEMFEKGIDGVGCLCTLMPNTQEVFEDALASGPAFEEADEAAAFKQAAESAYDDNGFWRCRCIGKRDGEADTMYKYAVEVIAM